MPFAARRACQVAAALQLAEILEAYLDRNITTLYSGNYPVWQVGAAALLPPLAAPARAAPARAAGRR
jgi:hypothetical protein